MDMGAGKIPQTCRESANLSVRDQREREGRCQSPAFALEQSASSFIKEVFCARLSPLRFLMSLTFKQFFATVLNHREPRGIRRVSISREPWKNTIHTRQSIGRPSECHSLPLRSTRSVEINSDAAL